VELLKRVTAVLICLSISPLAAMCEPQGAQRAGEIDAIIPAATRNSAPAKLKDEIDWNDLLQTTHKGRVRAGLADGSILSVGSDSELRVVEHNAASQQTSLELSYGKMRSQVQKITQPGGKFELKTPNAVIGAIGTVIYTAFASNKTTVICDTGTCSVTPLATMTAIILHTGQMIEITTTIPAGGFQASDVPPGLEQSTMLATDVPDNGAPPISAGKGGHGLRNVLIASGFLAVTGVVVGLTTTSTVKNCSIQVSSAGCAPK
jgi:FecR protein